MKIGKKIALGMKNISDEGWPMGNKVQGGVVATIHILKIHFMILKLSLKHLPFWRLRFIHFL